MPSKFAKSFSRRECANAALQLTALGFLVNRAPFAVAYSRDEILRLAFTNNKTFMASGYRDRKKNPDAKLYDQLALRFPDLAETQFIHVGHDVHGLAQNPRNLLSLFCVSKEGQEATLFPSLANSDQRVTVKIGSGSMFSGHAAYSLDGKTIATTETDLDGSTGIIVLRDAMTLKPVNEIASGGSYPHEICFLQNDKSLLVANGGFRFANSGMCLIDVASGKVVKNLPAPDQGAGVRHFAMVDTNSFVVGGWNRYDGKGYEGKEPEAKAFFAGIDDERQLLREISFGDTFKALADQAPTQFLSVAYHEPSQSAVLTVTGSDLVVVVDGRNGHPKKVLKALGPSGVALCSERDYVAVSSGDGSISYLDMRSLAFESAKLEKGAGLSGSHLYHFRAAS